MKILNKLTLKNLRLNKTRTIVTIIGILLSTALITVVAGMATSAQRTMINSEISWSGDFDVVLCGGTPENIKEIKANRNVKGVYIGEELGCAVMPEAKNENHPYIDIKAFSKTSFNDCFKLKLSEGRLPENGSELVLSQSVILNSDKKFAVGDKITLNVGQRTDGKGNIISSKFGYLEFPSESPAETVVEEIINTEEKTYKIVGILDECYSSIVCEPGHSACSTAITVADDTAFSRDNTNIYIDYLPEGEANYLKVTSQITGLSEQEVRDVNSGGMTDECINKSGYTDLSIHTNLLHYKGYGFGDATMTMLFSLAAIIIGIVILASIFVIRNSFAISITEKTKLYGMLASVGTTSKQIRKNVLFEGFCLGIIGIPLGAILGVSVIGILIIILNALLGDMLNGVRFEFCVPVVPIVIAVALSAVTILLSTLSTAVRASKIAPITAIRSNNDVKIRKKQKHYKAPKFIKKLFGMGGVVAYKNLKRSKKKYRTTVISIVVSVAMFVAISSFMDYGMSFANSYYGNIDYNICISSYCDNNRDLSQWEQQSSEIKKLDGIKDSVKSYEIYGMELLCGGKLTDDGVQCIESGNSAFMYINADGERRCEVKIVAFSDDSYKRILDDFNLNYDDMKGKAILYNNFSFYNGSGKKQNEKLFKDDGKLSFEYYDSWKGEKGENKIEVAYAFTELTDFLEGVGITDGTVIADRDWFIDNIDIVNTKIKMLINTDDANKLEDEILNLSYENIDVMNIDEMARQYNSMMLIMGIFIYGFIAVISLIGITNIFNTIATNMRLRSKEFAMLKSIGMTKREFNRMIRLESLFYGVKSLLIGIPLGLLGGVGIFCAFNQGSLQFVFVVPWAAIIISVVFVFLVVWMIMKYSVGKGNRQNIIETIRNDNI